MEVEITASCKGRINAVIKHLEKGYIIVQQNNFLDSDKGGIFPYTSVLEPEELNSSE